ncbi:MAG TPA: MOSC domain-containing protein [Thermoplasmata archaeon]|nr:MOSC domain-containing protein [Thermoplasmata archaeon]
MGTIVQVNVKPEPKAGTGLQKSPVAAAAVSVTGVQGDFNRYRHEQMHDDPDSAVLLMPIETLEELQAEGWPVRPGDLGENITTRGIAYAALPPGATVRAGTAVLQVSRACDPCSNLFELPYVGKDRGPQFLKVMMGRRGWYARVLRPGRVSPGDRVELVAAHDAPTTA